MKSVAKYLIAIGVCCIVNNSFAQTYDADETAALLEKYIENTESDVDYNDLYDQLEQLRHSPVDINTADNAALMKLPLMTPGKVNALLEHRRLYGLFKSVYELQVVDGFDPAYIRIILPFIAITSPLKIADRATLKDAGHEITTLIAQRKEISKGYLLPDSSVRRYNGSPVRVVMRYRSNIGKNLQFNFVSEKDAGEQLQLNTIFISGSILLKDVRRLKLLAIGDFQAAFGQGLTFGSGLSFGKSPFVMNIMRSQNGLRPYRSLNENEFLRGIGFTFQLHKHIDLNGFYSSNKIDATVFTDTLYGEDGFSGLISTGYYRSRIELSKRHTLRRTLSGMHTRYYRGNFEWGTTAIVTMFNTTQAAGDEPYQLFNNAGKKFINTGTDYRWAYRNLLLFGEWSGNGLKNISTVNGALISLGRQLDMSLLYRHYDKAYQPSISNAVGEYSDNKNENGCYAGFSLVPAKNFKLNGYADLYRSPWLRYAADAPSSGKDALLELQYTKRRQYSWYLRYRNEIKQKNEDGVQILNRMENNRRELWRFHIETIITPELVLRNRIEWVRSTLQYGRTTHGFLMFQDVTTTIHKRIKLTGRLMYFDVQDYNARVFAYESDMLYAFSVPAFQNRGTRFYLLMRYKVNKRLDIWLRLSRTAYENVDTVGSGYDTIEGNKVSDIKLQVRWGLGGV